MILILHCDDFENAPFDRVEEYESKSDLENRINELKKEKKLNSYHLVRGWTVAKKAKGWE